MAGRGAGGRAAGPLRLRHEAGGRVSSDPIWGGGALRPVAGDYLAIVDDNRSYNKLAPYVRERAAYDATIRPDMSVDVTLTIRYRVNPSPADLEGMGPGAGSVGTKHDYQNFLRVYVPAKATLLSMSGADVWAPVQANGLAQFAGRILVWEGASRTVVLRCRLPASVSRGTGFGRYRLTVRRQPGAALPSVVVRVRGSGGALVRARRVLRLSGDGHLETAVRGGSRPELGPPPGYSERDPYITYADFRDRRHTL